MVLFFSKSMLTITRKSYLALICCRKKWRPPRGTGTLPVTHTDVQPQALLPTHNHQQENGDAYASSQLQVQAQLGMQYSWAQMQNNHNLTAGKTKLDDMLMSSWWATVVLPYHLHHPALTSRFWNSLHSGKSATNDINYCEWGVCKCSSAKSACGHLLRVACFLES